MDEAGAVDSDPDAASAAVPVAADSDSDFVFVAANTAENQRVKHRVVPVAHQAGRKIHDWPSAEEAQDETAVASSSHQVQQGTDCGEDMVEEGEHRNALRWAEEDELVEQHNLARAVVLQHC